MILALVGGGYAENMKIELSRFKTLGYKFGDFLIIFNFFKVKIEKVNRNKKVAE